VKLAAVAITECAKRKSRSAVLTAHGEVVRILHRRPQKSDWHADYVLSVCFPDARRRGWLNYFGVPFVFVPLACEYWPLHSKTRINDVTNYGRPLRFVAAWEFRFTAKTPACR